MGGLTNAKIIDRFMRCHEGQAALNEIVEMLKGRTIVDVTFSNETHHIITELHLDDNEIFVVLQPLWEVSAIEEQFQEILEREYYVDYPDRKPDGYEYTPKPSDPCEKELRIWLDDVREPPRDESDFNIWVKTDTEAIKLIRTGCVGMISFDHDLGFTSDGREMSGYLVACEIEKLAHEGVIPRIDWWIHSGNPVGAGRIDAAMKSADKYWNRGSDDVQMSKM